MIPKITKLGSKTMLRHSPFTQWFNMQMAYYNIHEINENIRNYRNITK